MSDETQTPAESTPEKPPRNPMERLLVWGLIAAMLLIVATEGTARMGYTMSLNKIAERLEMDDIGEESKPLGIEEAETLLVGFPAKTEADGKVSFRWKGLIKDFGAIHLSINEEQHVLGYETDAPPEDEPIVVAEGSEEDSGMSGMEMPGGEGMSGGPGEGAGGGEGPGGRGQGQRFDPMQADTDGDGKISREEAPERMQAVFDEIDTNSDGFLDEAEFEARRASRQRARGQTEGRPDSGEDATPTEPSESPKGEETSKSTEPAETEKPDTENNETKESESTTQVPESAADRLQLTVEVKFNRTPLQDALEYLCDAAHLKLEIDGDALKDAGYTKNMVQDFDLGTVTVEQALAKIVGKYQEATNSLVVSLDDGDKTLHVLTQKFAEKKGMTVYKFQ